MATVIQPKQSQRDDERSETINAERPIWETVADIGAQISDDEWKKVPEDSSINYKRNLYGAPAKSV